MTKETMNELRHKVALAGLKDCTARLDTRAHSEYRNWWNPTVARPRVRQLIKELIDFYKGLDPVLRNQCPQEINAARAAIFAALIFTSEDGSEEQRDWSQRGSDSIKAGFDKTIRHVTDKLELYKEEQPAVTKGPSFFDSVKSFFSGLFEKVNTFMNSFFFNWTIFKKPKEEVVIAMVDLANPPQEIVKPTQTVEIVSPPETTPPVETIPPPPLPPLMPPPTLFFNPNNRATDQKVHQYLRQQDKLMRQFETLPDPGKWTRPRGEPGKKINKSKTH